jgi:outer membrane receptor protein involved in Fe transport
MRCVNWARRLYVVSACAALLVAPTGDLWAQVSGKVTGIVTDQTTGEPLVGAQVYIEGTGIGGLTADNGRFFLINVQPGTYVVVAELLGFSTMRRENVVIVTDVTRVLDFAMTPSAIAVEELVVEVEQTPLIELASTGSASTVTAAEISALPVSSLEEVLALQHGFLELPQNTDVISYLDTRRGITPVRIRGGRGGETLTMVDGIPINNFILGGAAFSISRYLVEQIDYKRGVFEPKYGNALSAIINMKTREPSDQIRGAVEWQSSGVAGALGNDYADLLDYDQIEGYVAGPVPGTADKLRFVIGGRNQNQADRVLGFDDDIMNPIQTTRDARDNFASVYDLIPGWRAIGYDDRRDIFGKMSFYFTPTTKLSATAIDYQRQTMPYDFEWLQQGFSRYDQCVALYPDQQDMCAREYLDGINPEKMVDIRRTRQEGTWMPMNTIEQRRTLLAVNWDHTIGRMAYNVAVGRFEQERETCVMLSGICLGSRIASTWENGPFRDTGGDKNYGKHPVFGSDDIFGGDKANSWFLRGDLQWQATDHHNIGTGLFYQTHDIEFTEGIDVGLNAIQLQWNRYAGEPWDAAAYVQDKIEYDFITIDLGFRIDYGKASGIFFVDPRDPTNGTTAFEVCENPTDWGFPSDYFTYTDPITGETATGITACAVNADLNNEAVMAAMTDDFTEATTRTQFSPRIGISFPVTAASSVFFNYGRFSQNPLLNNLYRSTNIGMYNCDGVITANPTGDNCTAVEGSRDMINDVVNSVRTPLVGNPHLVTEATSMYEFGFLSEVGDNWALSTILFSKDQYGLTGTRTGGVDPDGNRIFDAGSTYGATTYDYQVLLNLDYQTVRGLELSLRRRLSGYWAFDLRYSFSRIRTNAAAPELEVQKRDEGDDQEREEIRSEIDQPHVLNSSLRFQVGNEAPDIWGGSLLKNGTLSFTFRMASGLPYTPNLDIDGDLPLARNSGTMPMTWQVNMLIAKDFRFRGVNYGLFFRVNNLFNTVNCTQVFATTGNCDSGGINEDRLHNIRAGFSGSGTGTLTQNYDRADYVGSPRWMSFGLRLSF